MVSGEMEVEIHWVTFHFGVGGIKQADKAAKEAGGVSEVRRCLDYFTSLTQVNQTITERK